MKLYYSPGACSQAVHIALREAGRPFSLERVDLRTHRTESGQDWLSLNPKGYVPVLELDDGQRLTEAANLLLYVADQARDSGLAPAPLTMERYRLQEWLIFISSELHKSFSPLFDPTYPADAGQIIRQKIKRRLAYVADALGTRAFLLGDQFSVADAYLFVMLGWARKFDIDLEAYPALARYRERIAARPAVKDALAAERPPHP
jgi:glutathione S-transferase